MKQYILAFVLVWFIGCGGGGSSTTQDVETLSDNSFSAPLPQEQQNLQFNNIVGAYTMANVYVEYDDGEVVEANSDELQNSRMYIYYDNDKKLIYQSIYFEGEPIGKGTCTITQIESNNLYLSCGEEGEVVLEMSYENGTLLLENKNNDDFIEKDIWVRDDVLYEKFLNDLETRKSQVATQMAMLNKIAGKTMVLNYHLLFDRSVKITLDDEPVAVDAYDSVIKVQLGASTQSNEKGMCFNLSGLVGVSIYEYDYACIWLGSDQNEHLIVFNVDNTGTITGAYKYASSFEDDFSDALQNFDAQLIDSYIY